MSSNQSEPKASILERITLKFLLKTTGEVFISSFVISELVFLYFQEGGISRFPENLIVSLVILTAGLGLVDFLFADEVVFLTSCTSVVTIVAIINYLFGSSASPHILGTSVQTDFMAATGGGFSWALLYGTASSFITQRKLTKRHAELMFSAATGIFVIYSALTYSELITRFFDEHPWFPGTLVGIIALVGGIIIGRRERKEKKSLE